MAPAGRATVFSSTDLPACSSARASCSTANRYYIILPDGIGHGSSSKPSDGLHARFPQYDYEDMVVAQHALATQGLQVDHLRLVIGTSMGCMHSWLWAERYPDFMDAVMPLACLPVQIAGRNRLWRDLVMDAIRSDPQWQQGEYHGEPSAALRAAAGLLLIAGSAPIQMQIALPTRDAADEFLQKYMERELRGPGRERSAVPGQRIAQLRSVRGLEKITAPCSGSIRRTISSIRRNSASPNGRSSA